MQTKKHFARGFTLIELAIVIAIIAFIIGGIVAGRHLIQTAALQKVTADLEGYRKATATFKDKYLSLPGDFAEATNHWGAGTCPNTATVQQVPTCNGNGDGEVIISAASTYEHLLFWQHLANAKMIEGSYSGGGPGNTIYFYPLVGSATIGSSIPPGSVDGSGWSAVNIMSRYRVLGNYTDNLAFIFGGLATDGALSTAAILTPPDARSIDRKVDDGMPNFGTVRSPSALTNCYQLVGSVYSYRQLSTTECALAFDSGIR